ncbi:hypothetical protein V1477_019037 [Vespula maculifrons]|uniref:Uncharacterized protein n=1 Tax=Vespula maculifrons TaxID=7453 RepID=A0ABD2AV52_VESMC
MQWNTCMCENHEIEMKRRPVHPTETRVPKSSSIFLYRKKETRTEAHPHEPHPWFEFDGKDLGKMLKCAAIRSEIFAASKLSIHDKYRRPRSHRVEIAACGDPRTNGDSTFYYYYYYYQESKATGRPPLPTNSSLQTLKLQPHASPHLGTDLRIAQLSNIGSFDHHLSTTGRAFATNAGTQH